MSTFTYVLGNIENGVFSDELNETIAGLDGQRGLSAGRRL